MWFAQFYAFFAAAAASVLITAALAFCTARRTPRGFYAVFAAVVVCCAVASSFCLARLAQDEPFPDSAKFTARVLLVRPWGRSAALLLETPYGRAAAYVPQKEAPRAGAEVFVRAASFEFKKAERPGGFDERFYWRARNASRRLVVFEMKETGAPRGLAAWRARVERAFAEKLPPLSSAYMAALTTGARDDDIQELHKKTGTSHLLAISGFHVALLAGALFWLFGKNLSGAIAVSAAIWLYVAAAGAPAGGLRAALMTELCLAAFLAGRPRSAFNGVSCAALFLLLWNPWYFFDLGFRLSVLAALFISAAASVVPQNWKGAAAVSVLVWFVTAPLTASAFGLIPMAGLVLNIVAVPWFSLIFPLVALLSLPALAGLPFARIAAAASEALLLFSHKALSAGSSLVPWAAGPSSALTAAALVIFICAVCARCRVKMETAPILCAIFLFILLYCPSML